MKKFPKPCKQAYKSGQQETMFIALPHPKDPTKPKRYYLGPYYSRSTREIYDYLNHLYAVGYSREDIAALLETGAAKNGLRALQRATQSLQTTTATTPPPPTTIAPTPPTTITVADLFALFIESREGVWRRDYLGKRPTLRRYSRVLALLKQYDSLHAREVNTLTRQDIRGWRDWLVKSGYNRPTVNQYVSCLKAVYRRGVDEGWVSENAYTSISVIRNIEPGDTEAKEAKRCLSVSPDIVYATLPFLTSPAKEIVELLLLTGARASEICSLNLSEIDKTSYPDTWVYRPSQHKTARFGNERAIPLNQEAQSIITTYVKSHRVKGPYLFTRSETTSRTKAAQYAPGTLRAAVLSACKRASLPLWNPKQLRKTVGTTTAQNNVQDAQALLGHTSTVITEKHYIDPKEERAVEVAKRLHLPPQA